MSGTSSRTRPGAGCWWDSRGVRPAGANRGAGRGRAGAAAAAGLARGGGQRAPAQPGAGQRLRHAARLRGHAARPQRDPAWHVKALGFGVTRANAWGRSKRILVIVCPNLRDMCAPTKVYIFRFAQGASGSCARCARACRPVSCRTWPVHALASLALVASLQLNTLLSRWYLCARLPCRCEP